MTERPEGLDDLLDYIADNMDPIEAVRHLHATLSDEDFAALVFQGTLVRALMAHGTPEDYDAWLRILAPDDKRLAYYRWIGTAAVCEAVADAKHHLWEDPLPPEHRHYDQDVVEEILDLMAPGEGDVGYPSVLPLGHPFCDVQWHTHTDGSGRLPTCRLDSPE